MSAERQLPEGWHILRFGDVVREVSQSTRTPLENGFERYIGLEHLDPDTLSLKRWGMIAEDNPTFTKVFRTGQLLFGRRRAYQRKAAVAHFDGICSGDIIVMEAKPEHLLPGLLPFIIQSEGFWDYAIKTSAGSLSPRTKWANLAAYEFSLPPMDQQRRIAEILGAVEEAIEEYLAVESTTQIAKKVFAEEQFESLLCEDLTFRQVGEWLSGGTPSRNNPSFWNGNIPWASPKDMKVDVLHDTEEHVSDKGVQSGSRIIPANSILFVTRGMILAHSFPVALTGTQMAFNQDLRAIVPYESFDASFIFYWIQHNAPKFLAYVTESSHGTKRLSSSVIESMLFPTIALSNQQLLAKRLASFDEQTNKVVHHSRELRKLKKELIYQLLDGVPLNVQ